MNILTIDILARAACDGMKIEIKVAREKGLMTGKDK